jgi:signal transduction histidine kinase
MTDGRDVYYHDAVEAEPLRAEVDAPKLAQVVSNLVRNGIEAVTAGGHVWVALVPAEECFVIRVGDDGPGIPDEVRPRIYEPFFSTRDHGRGLGLAIVHTFVSLHRGRIEVTSRPQETAFVVSIPRSFAS